MHEVQANPRFQERLKREVPLGRLVSADEDAAFVAYLCSEVANCFVGQVFPVSGGWVSWDTVPPFAVIVCTDWIEAYPVAAARGASFASRSMVSDIPEPVAKKSSLAFEAVRTRSSQVLMLSRWSAMYWATSGWYCIVGPVQPLGPHRDPPEKSTHLFAEFDMSVATIRS